jgi:hypothetical protein
VLMSITCVVEHNMLVSITCVGDNDICVGEYDKCW